MLRVTRKVPASSPFTGAKVTAFPAKVAKTGPETSETVQEILSGSVAVGKV
jgi:hypothetical protein